MFEHMAFKGSRDRHEGLREGEGRARGRGGVQAYEAERSGRSTRPGRVDRAEGLQGEGGGGGTLVEGNGFDEAVSREGGVGLNASTSADETAYSSPCPPTSSSCSPISSPSASSTPCSASSTRSATSSWRSGRTDREPALGRLIEQSSPPLPGPPLRPADRRLHQRPPALHDHRRREFFRRTTSPPTWSRPSSATSRRPRSSRSSTGTSAASRPADRSPCARWSRRRRPRSPSPCATVAADLLEGYHKPPASPPTSRLRRAWPRSSARAHLAPLPLARREAEARGPAQVVVAAWREVPAPVRRAGRCPPAASATTRCAEALHIELHADGDRGRDRRRTRTVQDAGQG